MGKKSKETNLPKHLHLKDVLGFQVISFNDSE